MKLASKVIDMHEVKDKDILKSVVVELQKDSNFSTKKDFKAFHVEALKRAKDKGADTSKMTGHDVLAILDKL